MENNDSNKDSKHIECMICLKEVPLSEAKNVEAADYVMHFCGLDCYHQWMKAAEKNSKK